MIAELVVAGTVVTPDAIIPQGWVAVRDGCILEVGSGPRPEAARTRDFGAALVLPGAIDGQVHSRSQAGQEDFIWTTRAAAAGGVTTIIDMPYERRMPDLRCVASVSQGP